MMVLSVPDRNSLLVFMMQLYLIKLCINKLGIAFNILCIDFMNLYTTGSRINTEPIVQVS